VKLGERLAKLDTIQQSKIFKVIATAALAVLLVVGYLGLWVVVNDPEFGQSIAEQASNSGSVYRDRKSVV